MPLYAAVLKGLCALFDQPVWDIGVLDAVIAAIGFTTFGALVVGAMRGIRRARTELIGLAIMGIMVGAGLFVISWSLQNGGALWMVYAAVGGGIMGAIAVVMKAIAPTKLGGW